MITKYEKKVITATTPGDIYSSADNSKYQAREEAELYPEQ
jgi:hypothetical protein